MDAGDHFAELQQEAFFVALGQSIDSARLAQLSVVLELIDGTTVQGVPQEPAQATDGESEIDHTGTRSHLELNGQLVMLERVCRYSLTRPPQQLLATRSQGVR